MGTFLCIFSGLAGDYLALVCHDALHQLDVGGIAHSLVAVAAHTDGHDIFRVFKAADAVGKETVEIFAVGVIVPCTVLVTVTRIFLMVAPHRLVV